MSEKYFELSRPIDILIKAKREFEKMRNDLNTDNIFNFFVTAYHIMDYVKSQGKASQDSISKMYSDKDFQMCNYLCNKGKHLELRSGDPYRTEYNSGAVWGKSVWGQFAWGEPESWTLIADGIKVNLIELSCRLIEKWEKFILENNL